MLLTAAPTALAEAEWTAREAAHQARMDTWVAPHQERRRTGTAHPVLDFLFTYYSETPNRLRRWHPGAGTVLLGDAARERLAWPLYAEVDGLTADGDAVRGVGLDRPAFLAKRRSAAGWVEGLLSATAGRAGQFGCFGMHEWAMLYRPGDGEVRHELPLRLGQAGTDAVVESHKVQCSHIDAFRFFTRAGVPRNTLQPTRDTQQQLEQPGCLHATMDLYKWAYKLSPATPASCWPTASPSPPTSVSWTCAPRPTTSAGTGTHRSPSRHRRARRPTSPPSAASPPAARCSASGCWPSSATCSTRAEALRSGG
ncbi:3-methyladenine DNA glycosylase [Modestobacter sp. L9-4]|uniref:3-methyladenine DNA glycosylase n=1 Tax=Modestobacter sp. L9-4 TaxID=2851567 RepID=UPI001F169E82|nr:3-methyladenine DNA glycosylase [Modestobacter sp. L9-4]